MSLDTFSVLLKVPELKSSDKLFKEFQVQKKIQESSSRNSHGTFLLFVKFSMKLQWFL